MDKTRDSYTKESQKEKDKYCYDILYMWNLKQGTNEPIYKTETDSQTQKIGLCVVKGEGEGQTGSLGLVDANCYIQNG